MQTSFGMIEAHISFLLNPKHFKRFVVKKTAFGLYASTFVSGLIYEQSYSTL